MDLLTLLVLKDSEEEEQSLGHAQISNVKKQCYVCVWRAILLLPDGPQLYYIYFLL